MTIDEKIAVMTASKEGKKVERKSKGSERWIHCIGEPEFNFHYYEYRIKQEESPFEWNLDKAEVLLGKMTRNEYCSSIITYIDEIQFRHGLDFYKYNCTDKIEIKIDGNWIPFQDYKPEKI